MGLEEVHRNLIERILVEHNLLVVHSLEELLVEAFLGSHLQDKHIPYELDRHSEQCCAQRLRQNDAHHDVGIPHDSGFHFCSTHNRHYRRQLISTREQELQ